MQFRDLHAQYLHLKPRIDAAVRSVCENGQYIAGPEVKQLEQVLAEYVGVKHCISCGNGTDALQLALMAWNVGKGDAVFVPDFTFFASAEAPALLGATPVFVDVDERTFNLDPLELEKAIVRIESEGRLAPKAVVAVDLFGLPADYTALRSVCERHGVLMLEDGAQGFGGEIRGKRACSFGDISTTSFFPAKPLGCYGDGGAIFTDDDDWASLMRSYAVHGKGSMKYDNVRIGVNSRLDTMQAAVLLVKFEAFVQRELDSVNVVAQAYSEALAGSGLVLPVVPDGYRSSWAQYTVQVSEEVDRAALQEALKSEGIPTMVYYPRPMSAQTAFGKTDYEQGDCSVAKRLTETVLSLPMGPYLESDDAVKVAMRLRALLHG